MAETSILFKVETADANKKVRQLEQEVAKLERTVARTGGTTKTTGSAFKGVGLGAKAAGVGVKGFGAALSAALGPLAAVAAAAGSLTQAFDVLRQQDFAEAKVRSLGVNSEELTARLSDVSRELSGQASVVGLTAAAYDVASAGFTNAADAANILKAASQGAAGGFSDINTVGDATTSVLNAYGLEADKAAKLVDGFIQTQNDGKIVIGEYAANIAKVAPVAAALSVPLEEVNAAVAQITAGGQVAEVTFTALKTAFAQIAAGKVGKELEAFGITVNASTLASEGLAGTLQKIKDSGADAGTVIKAFGTEAGPSILALLNDTEKYNQLLKNQVNAQGAAAKAAFEASDTINGQLTRLSTAFQNIFADQSELGELIKNVFKVAAVTVEAFGAALKVLAAPARAIHAAVTEIGEAIASALGVTGINVAMKLEEGFQKYLSTLVDVGNFIVGLGKRIGQFLGAQVARAINAAQSIRNGILNAFGGVFERVGSFIQKAYMMIPKPIRDFLEGAATGVQSFISETTAIGKGVTTGDSGGVAPSLTDLGGGGLSAGGGAQAKGAKQQVDMSEKLLELKRAMRAADEAGNERELATLQLMIQRQEIMEGTLTGNKKANALEDATHRFRQQIFAIDKRIADQRDKMHEDAQRQFKEFAEAERDAAQKRLEADPGYQMKQQLEETLKLQNQVAAGATAIGNAFGNAFRDVITGSKSANEALADMMSAVAEHFMNMATQIIAQQLAMILYGTIMKALGVSLPSATGGGGPLPGAEMFTGGFKLAPFAEGGFVNRPTNALIGEGGEPEYVIPESKMRESMARYSRGSRGASVIPGGDGDATTGEGGIAVAAPIDVRYTVERINSVDYVTADQFQRGMQSAATQGAKQGEQNTLKRLQMSSSTRKRLGM
jgi:TP901 family phage tail tape measure protein